MTVMKEGRTLNQGRNIYKQIIKQNIGSNNIQQMLCLQPMNTNIKSQFMSFIQHMKSTIESQLKRKKKKRCAKVLGTY